MVHLEMFKVLNDVCNSMYMQLAIVDLLQLFKLCYFLNSHDDHLLFSSRVV